MRVRKAASDCFPLTAMSRKVVLVTGCSAGGIGFSLCEEFAKKGCKVYATARNVVKMSGFKPEFDIERLQMDVTDDSSVDEALKEILKREGKVDVLVNNAGVACYGPALEIPLAQVQTVLDANFVSVLRVSRKVLPYMAERKEGLIVNVGSILGELHAPWSGIYSSSKAAVSALSNVMEMECRPFNVRVMLVLPGGVQSNVASNASTQFSLAENTLYKKYLNNIVKCIWGSQAPGSMDTGDFARAVVNKVLASSPPFRFTTGSDSLIFQILQCLPVMWVHNLLWRKMGSVEKKD